VLAVEALETRVRRAQYVAAIKRLGFRLARPDLPFEQPGDTFFGALTPAMAVEDLVHLQLLLDRNLIAPEVIGSLLMVDFPNPVFSQKRASLARHLTGLAKGESGAALLARLIAIVEQAASDQPACAATDLDACTGDRQFLHYAKIAQTADWRDEFTRTLRTYSAAVAGRLLADAKAGDDYVGLLAWRRQRFRELPRIAESKLLFPTLDNAVSERAMRLNATVAVAPR